jgi:hypothetical protein
MGTSTAEGVIDPHHHVWDLCPRPGLDHRTGIRPAAPRLPARRSGFRGPGRRRHGDRPGPYDRRAGGDTRVPGVGPGQRPGGRRRGLDRPDFPGCRPRARGAAGGAGRGADERRTDPQRALGMPGIQSAHSALRLGAGPGRQLPQDLFEYVASMPHVNEGTVAARTLRVLRRGGVLVVAETPGTAAAPRLGGARVDVVVVRKPLYSIYRSGGSSREAVDGLGPSPTRQE